MSDAAWFRNRPGGDEYGIFDDEYDEDEAALDEDRRAEAIIDAREDYDDSWADQ